MAFYAWRLYQTNCCSVTVVNGDLNPKNPIVFKSTSLTNSTASFQPKKFYLSIDQISLQENFDTVIISSSSLQDFQTVCSKVAHYVNENSTIIIELTGFVHLEPFVTLSFPKLKKLTVSSIMTEFDVRHITGNTFHQTCRGGESRLYIGTPSTSSSTTSFKKTLKLFQLIQDDSNNEINLLIANLSKEFMTYQWKLALPRIIFNPLSIIFETEFPSKLSEQILCKPLVSGLITEIFKIIKKMESKLVKGSENEVNLWKNWNSLYPDTSSSSSKDKSDPHYLNSPQLFYNYYNQQQLDIDLLLLQPILLADDHGIRTPYLENLYSIMCQYIKVNDKKNKLIFFQRKSDVDDTYENEVASGKLLMLNKQVNDLELHLKSLHLNQSHKEVESNQISIEIERGHAEYKNLKQSIEGKSAEYEKLQEAIKNKQVELQQLEESFSQQSQAQKHLQQPEPVLETPKISRQSFIASPRGMKEMSDIAIYGAALNGENVPMIEEESQHYQPGEQAKEDFVGYKVDANEEKSKHEETLKLDTQGIPQNTRHQQQYQAPPPPPPQQQVQQAQQGYGQYPQQHYKNQQNFPPPQSFTQQGPPGPPGPPGHQRPGTQGQGQGYHGQPPQSGPQVNGGYGYNGYNVPNGYIDQFNGQYNGQVNGPYQQSPMDQHPPHGLPTNGGIAPIFNNNSISSQSRFQQQQQYPQQSYPMNNGYGQNKRLNTMQSSHSFYDNGSQVPHGPQGPQGPQGAGQVPNGYGYNNQNNGSNPNNMKKNGRRSMFPQPTGNSLQGIDMGGRGGMPMPSGPTGERPGASGSTKGRPVTMMSPTLTGTTNNVGMNGNYRKSQGDVGRDLQIPQQHGSHLQIPAGNNRSNTSSVSTNDTPKTSGDDVSEVKVQAPPAENIKAKPLGVTKDTKNDMKPQKRGLFGKKKK